MLLMMGMEINVMETRITSAMHVRKFTIKYVKMSTFIFTYSGLLQVNNADS